MHKLGSGGALSLLPAPSNATARPLGAPHAPCCPAAAMLATRASMDGNTEGAPAAPWKHYLSHVRRALLGSAQSPNAVSFLPPGQDSLWTQSRARLLRLWAQCGQRPCIPAGILGQAGILVPWKGVRLGRTEAVAGLLGPSGSVPKDSTTLFFLFFFLSFYILKNYHVLTVNGCHLCRGWGQGARATMQHWEGLSPGWV